MPYEIVTIPFDSVTKTFHADDLNKFYLNKKVLNIKTAFLRDEKNIYWTVFIEYETILQHPSIEPKGLTEAGRIFYKRLRAWRKERA